MAVVRGAFNQLLVPGARKVFVDEYNELPAIYPELFNIETSSRAFEDELVMTGLPIAVSKPEGEPIAFDRPRFRGRVRYIHSGFGLGYEITKETVEDDLYKAVNSQGATNLARSLRETEEVSAHAVFNNAFTTVQGYDAVPLISDQHTGVGSLTFSNLGDGDLSVAQLKAAQEYAMLLQNDRGLRIRLSFSTLFVPAQSLFTANEILGAEFSRVAETDLGLKDVPNVTKQFGLKVKWSPFLTDPDSFYVMTDKSQHTFKWFWRRRPDDENGYDARSQVSWYGITARWSNGVTDWRHIWGSPGY